MWSSTARALLMLASMATIGCVSSPRKQANASPSTSAEALESARDAAAHARRASGNRAAGLWLACASDAHSAIALGDASPRTVTLLNRCTDAWLTLALDGGNEWEAGRTRAQGHEIHVEFRGLSPYLAGKVRLVRAADVSMQMYDGARFVQPGMGVPLALQSPRCDDRPACTLLPYSGVFRPATAWIESDPEAEARLVIVDPWATPSMTYASVPIPVAADSSAFYAQGMAPSPVGRLAIWGLLGGDDIGRRAGVYLMEDYDPHKRPLVMVHGLGSSPLAWAKLSNAVWGRPELRRNFQIWHVVYSSDAPLFVARQRLAEYLDTAFSILDPEHDDEARNGIVLVGHSLGGVLARLLCADSGNTLWSAAFTVPPERLQGDAADVAMVQRLLFFKPYPGISRAIFLAAPHRGSPLASRWYARFVSALAGGRTPEMQALRRIARTQPDAIRNELRLGYQRDDINSIWTLQAAQPVRKVSETLLPAGIPYHTIAGRLPGRTPETDGAVPLSSALLPGSTSTLVVDSAHDVYRNDDAIDEIVRILESAVLGGAAPP